MGGEFLGKGWSFPLYPDTSGALSYVEGEEDIEQALRIILMTRVGERLMRFDFGSAVRSYLFAPGSPRYLGLIEEAVRVAVRDWEPRVELLSATAAPGELDPSRVTVSIDYVVRRTNNTFNMVFPFYVGDLQGG
jgi:hypothetical protein